MVIYDLKKDSRSSKSVSIRILSRRSTGPPSHRILYEKDVYTAFLAGDTLFLAPRGQGSANFPQRGLACAEPAAKTLFRVWANTELFRFLFHCVYFVLSGPSLISTGTPKPPPRPSAKPTKRIAKRHTHQLFSENVSMLQDVRDKGLLHHLTHVLCHAVSLCRTNFASPGIAKPRYVAACIRVQPERQ